MTDYIELRKLAEEARDSYTPGGVDITPEEERFYDEVTPGTFLSLLDRITELEDTISKVRERNEVDLDTLDDDNEFHQGIRHAAFNMADVLGKAQAEADYIGVEPVFDDLAELKAKDEARETGNAEPVAYEVVRRRDRNPVALTAEPGNFDTDTYDLIPLYRHPARKIDREALIDIICQNSAETFVHEVGQGRMVTPDAIEAITDAVIAHLEGGAA